MDTAPADSQYCWGFGKNGPSLFSLHDINQPPIHPNESAGSTTHTPNTTTTTTSLPFISRFAKPSPLDPINIFEDSPPSDNSMSFPNLSMSNSNNMGWSFISNASNSTPTAGSQGPSNIFIAGLPIDFDECRLRALFSSFGEIVSCKIMVDIDSGISKGFGFVLYRHAGDAAKAIDNMNGKKLNAQVPRALYVTLAQHDGTPAITECERVYVRNIPCHVTDAVLQRYFETYGEVMECKVLRHSVHEGAGTSEGQSRGVAFVRFRTVGAAQAAVTATQGSRPFGSADKPLMVRFAESHEARQQRQTRRHSTGGHSSTGEVTPTLQAPPPMVWTVAAPNTLPAHPPRPASPPGAFVWEDPATGFVFATTVVSANPPDPAGGPARMLHQPSMSCGLPPYVVTTAPQYFSHHHNHHAMSASHQQHMFAGMTPHPSAMQPYMLPQQYNNGL